MRLLLIDDSSFVRKTVRKVIARNSKLDFLIEEAENGEQGLAKFLGGQFDLVVVDWKMPVMDGLEFVRRVRDVDKEVPLIMLTSLLNSEDIVLAGEAGVNTYVEKPAAEETIWEAIEHYVLEWEQNDQSGL